MKVFNITLTTVYNNDEVKPDEISDNIFKTMKKIDKGLAILTVNSIKENSNPNQYIKEIIENMAVQDEKDLEQKKDHSEISLNNKIKKSRKRAKKSEDKK